MAPPEKTQKRKKSKKSKFEGINLDFIKEKLTSLQSGNRFQEAIIYAYYNYMILVQGYYSMPRRPSQTAREYAMDMVKKVKLPPTLIYPFTTLFEEARFNAQPMNAEQYNEALKLFMDLYNRIMGGPKEIGQAASSA
ncbi:MAG: DUF4129 domain-containing protein [Promethearchaeota archaeon]|nr:MAG: DUF4129 domain-containing protein [Candidatus Lokiarchaeota archaeon]